MKVRLASAVRAPLSQAALLSGSPGHWWQQGRQPGSEGRPERLWSGRMTSGSRGVSLSSLEWVSRLQAHRRAQHSRPCGWGAAGWQPPEAPSSRTPMASLRLTGDEPVRLGSPCAHRGGEAAQWLPRGSWSCQAVP